MNLDVKTPVIGGARDSRSCSKTVDVYVRKLTRLGKFSPAGRMLDVGCGDGTFTVIFGQPFNEVHGIDVQEQNLDRFRASVQNEKKFVIASMSASALAFPESHFDTIITIETLEHVPNLADSVSEICRVLKRGGGIDYHGSQPVVSL